MNQAQINGILRLVVSAGTPIGALIATVGLDPKALADWVIAGIPMVMILWSYFANRHSTMATEVSNIPGVTVMVGKDAPADMVAVAKDTSEATKNVVLTPVTPPPSNLRRR